MTKQKKTKAWAIYNQECGIIKTFPTQYIAESHAEEYYSLLVIKVIPITITFNEPK